MIDASLPIFEHQPVMLREITEIFAHVPDGFVLDATLGGAGHATALLTAHDGLKVLGLDRDPVALSVSQERLATFVGRVVTQHRRFDDLDAAMNQAGIAELSGALFDLGVSSHQLDTGDRGFSYRQEAMLDMRMDTTEVTTVTDIVNTATEQELARILRDYSDERFAGRIARVIIAARPIQTTTELADIVASSIPAPARRRGGHPAKRTFQALRIALNKELEILPDALDSAIRRTQSGGRVAVLSYHSGEDRIVKQFIARHASDPFDRRAPYAPARAMRLKAICRSKPGAAELAANPRARSAIMRVAQRTSA